MKIILADENGFQVLSNGSGDLFIQDSKSGTMIRVGRNGIFMSVTASYGVLAPYAVNGLPAFIIRKN